ncbi:MAG: rod shape-determining protein MreC [Betaproteobacteria bacterium]
MDRAPPPFFRQGLSADVRLILFAIAAIALLVLDARMAALDSVRRIVGSVLYPIQRALLTPRDAGAAIGEYVGGVARLRLDNDRLVRLEAANAGALQQGEHLAAENMQLRKLLGMRERNAFRSTVAEVLFETSDPFTRRLVVDRGAQHGLQAGQPVLDSMGVVGQISRVLPFSAEVTLLSDRASTLPVEIRRNGVRAVAYGAGRSGMIELRFLPASFDVREGDDLTTSGLDGVFPPGLPVGRIVEVRRGGSSFTVARVDPVAAVERSRMLLILLEANGATPSFEPPKPPSDTPARARGSRSKGGG